MHQGCFSVELLKQFLNDQNQLKFFLTLNELLPFSI
jgi:hypothetical protein